MVSARQTFLMAGHYVPMAQALKAVTVYHALNPSFVFEAGAGTGYYIARVLDALPLACGLLSIFQRALQGERRERIPDSAQS